MGEPARPTVFTQTFEALQFVAGKPRDIVGFAGDRVIPIKDGNRVHAFRLADEQPSLIMYSREAWHEWTRRNLNPGDWLVHRLNDDTWHVVKHYDMMMSFIMVEIPS